MAEFLRSVAVVMILVLYALLWFAIQPFILDFLIDLCRVNGGEVNELLVIFVLIVVNTPWLFSWYKLTLYVKEKWGRV